MRSVTVVNTWSPVFVAVEREEKMTKLTNTREDMLQKKKQEAELHKQRTAQMYDNMAKSAPAGEQKKLDTSILKTETTTTTKSKY